MILAALKSWVQNLGSRNHRSGLLFINKNLLSEYYNKIYATLVLYCNLCLYFFAVMQGSTDIDYRNMILNVDKYDELKLGLS